MKLQQLRYAVEVFRRHLNVSEAADALFTSQPGVSKQIRLLEEELGTQIFIRSGKRIVAVTEAGLAILDKAAQVLLDVQNIKKLSGEFSNRQHGTFTIATTHVQANYVLPDVVKRFMLNYPEVYLTIKLGSPSEIAQMVYNGEADLAIGQQSNDYLDVLRRLPYGYCRYVLLLPNNHALLQSNHVSIKDIATYPLLTDDFAFTSVLSRSFQREEIAYYRIALESADNELLKYYVRLGLGVGLLNKEALKANQDDDLHILDIAHLFEPLQNHIVLRPDVLIRNYVYDFINYLSPNLSKERVDQLLYAPVLEDFSI